MSEQPQQSDRTYEAYDPRIGKDEEQPQAKPLTDDNGNKIQAFDPQYIEPFRGLLYVGSLSSGFTWLNHRFVIRSLSSDDILMAGQLMNEWKGTKAEQWAYTVAIVSIVVVSVDGQPLVEPLGPLTDTAMGYERFRFVNENWFPATIEKVFEEHMLLDAQVANTISALEKA